MIAVLLLAGCSQERHLETGDNYLHKGKLKEAAIMYRKALDVDPKFGLAYYELASVYTRLGQPSNAYPALQRAVELLPKGFKKANEMSLNLAELSLIAAQSTENAEQRETLLASVEFAAGDFLQRNPQSFEGHKLRADLLLAASVGSFRKNRPIEGKASRLPGSLRHHRPDLLEEESSG